MKEFRSLQDKIFELEETEFEEVALRVFRLQARCNPVYREYIGYLGINPKTVTGLSNIPFLPIEFFKYKEVVTGSWEPEAIFESSRTTSDQPGRHSIKSLSYYQKVCLTGFTKFIGQPEEFHIFALLPSYLERKNASLVAMMQFLIDQSGSELSGFYLNEYEQLRNNLEEAIASSRKVLLLGVTFALLDFAEAYPMDLGREAIVMETGGMKGRREELVREQVHQILKDQFKVSSVASEYGMTELNSQAYAPENGQFFTPSWMKVIVRDLHDPFAISTRSQGAINIIDLANIHSCAFIETADLGRLHKQTFEVTGRSDHSDIRGCNLMVW